MGTLIAIIVVSMIITAACKAYEDDKLLKTNPEAWKAKKEQEAAEKERKQQRLGNAAETGFKIAKMFWK